MKKPSVPSLEELPCPACGCHAPVTPDMAAMGERENPHFLRCSACGSERIDLSDYYGDVRAAA